MNYLAQIILAARDRDVKEWPNILFIVVVAVFWAVGGILKAKANKPSRQDQEQPERKGGLKPAEGTRTPRAFQQKTSYQQPQAQRPVSRPQVRQAPRRKVARPQPIVQKLETLEPPRPLQVSPQAPQLQPDFQELPDFTGETVKKLKGKRIATPAETPQPKYVAELLSDYADPNQLKRAILHYEILGKPLSLRGPSEHIIGL